MLKRANPLEIETPDGFAPVQFSSSDGLRLFARDYGRDNAIGHPERLPVVCLPGLVQNGSEFHRLALTLSQSANAPRRVVSFDYRGRGLSDRAGADSYNLATEAEDVLTGLAALGLDRAAFVGTSRGALIIHMLAAMRPGVLAAVVLNDTGPVIDGAGLVQMKAHLERMPDLATLAKAADHLRTTRAKSFPLLDEENWLEFATTLFRQSGDRLLPDYDLALLKQLKGLDLNTPLPELWPQFEALRTIPLMTVRGEYSNLLSKETVAEMARRHPGMSAVEAKGQGHAPLLHLDRLDAKIAAFLRANDPL